MNVYHASSYDPDEDSALSVNWTSLYYKGTVTVNQDGTVELQVTHGIATYDGTESWTGNPGNTGMYVVNNDVARLSDYSGEMLCNIFRTGTHSSNPGTRPCVTAYPKNSSYTGKNWIYIIAPSGTTAAAVKAILAETPKTVVYPLATPLTYQLDSVEQLYTLDGDNVLWADSGEVEVTVYGTPVEEPDADALQSLNILLGKSYSRTGDDPTDEEALDIILGGTK